MEKSKDQQKREKQEQLENQTLVEFQAKKKATAVGG